MTRDSRKNPLATITDLGGVGGVAITGTPTLGQVPVANSSTTAVWANQSTISAVMGINVQDFGATGDGSTNDTTAIAAAYGSAVTLEKPLYFPAGDYLVTALPDFANNTEIIGDGQRNTIILYAGTGTLRQLSNKYGINFRHICFRGTGVGSTLLRLSNCFRISFQSCRFLGAHTDASGTSFRTQVGLLLDSNTGASFINNCDFENLGNGIRTQCIQNFVNNSKFTVCYRSIYGVGGTASAGLALSGVEFTGGGTSGTTDTHIYIDGSADTWTLWGCWFEKCQYACRVGVGGTGGPAEWTMVGCKIGASVLGIDLIYCRQPTFVNCKWDIDDFGTQTEVNINSTNAEEGLFLSGVTTLRADFADSDFPQYWTVTRKGSFRAGGVRASGGFEMPIGGEPSTATSTGTAGQIRLASGFIYICTGTNTWRRVAIAAW